MNQERRVNDVEMHWTLEADQNGDNHLVAHWVEATTPGLIHLAA